MVPRPDGRHDPTTRSVTPSGAVASYTWKVVPPQPYKNQYVDGKTIKREDLITWIAAEDLTFTPVNGMLVTFKSTKFKIVAVDPIYSGDLVCLYELQLRK